MFTPKYLKQAKMLDKGVKKFLHYKADLIPEETMEKLESLRSEFRESVRSRDRGEIEEKAKRLTRACEKAVPPPSHPGWRENLEVILVAVVIAVGIRAYFLQPFKIPTGSMRPTLNGIIATPLGEKEFEEERPGAVGTVWQYLFAGRNYVNVVVPEDGQIRNIREKTRAKFFTFTQMDFEGESGATETLSIYAPLNKVLEDFGLAQRFRIAPNLDRRSYNIQGGEPYRVVKGDVLARGYIDTGDQVLVNKFAYHFRAPKRGEVFVFNTRDITGIKVDPRQGSQHYIKRLAGLPGDKLEVRSPELWIDDKKATEQGFRRVMEDYREIEGHEKGYTMMGRTKVKLGAERGRKEYWAMGDNSDRSSDSREWGVVPEENIVGPALVVYWPFAHHWGLIR